MPITLVTTYGGATSNTYISVSTANTLVQANTLNSEAWDEAGEDVKARALIVATNTIDACRWAGAKYYYDQRLKFPRTVTGAENPGETVGDAGSPSYANLLENDIFQQRMKERVEIATALQAVYLIQSSKQDGGLGRHRKLQRQGIMSWSRSVGGSVSESYSYGRSELVCPEAWEQLYHYKGVARVTRGDSQSIESD